MKQIVFSKLWEYNTYYKVEWVCLQNKSLERSTWIKSGAIVKEVFKDWNALLASTPQEKIDPFESN
jgi:hypothetical protein